VGPHDAARPTGAEAAAAAIPESAFLPFDRATAVNNDIVDLCGRWTAAPAFPGFAPGPVPDVPVLVIEGEDDLRTPVEGARRAAASFPHARLLVAPGVGHSALGADMTGCTTVAFRRFMEGRRFSTRCRRTRRDFLPAPPPPLGIGDVRPAAGVTGARGRVLGAIGATLHDVAFDAIAALNLDPAERDFAHGGGLRAGSYRLDTRGDLWLRRLAFVPGVRLEGRIRNFVNTRRQRGRIRIEGGRRLPDGFVRIRGRRIRGVLDGRRVAAPLDPPFAAASVEAAAAPSGLPGR
jgi:TAP-like protein